MPATQSKNTSVPGIPEMPAIAREMLKLDARQTELSQVEINQTLIELRDQYPQFFDGVVRVINSDYLNLTSKVKNIQQAVSVAGLQQVTQLVLIQLIYLTLEQYKINGLDRQAFWQDVIRRAVSCGLLAELLEGEDLESKTQGLNVSECFFSGFLQDIGFLLLFFEQPEKGVLWSEFHKREPDARLNMEHRVFNKQHDSQLKLFLHAWKILPELSESVCAHHSCDNLKLTDSETQLCKILNCSDWLSAVYTAEDKNYVIDRCRKILADEFGIASYITESLLAAIPDKVDSTARALAIDVNTHEVFSQILYQTNIRLNEDNDKFQELTLRLDQAIEERDRLAAELDRDLSMAREIQQSLLPAIRESAFPVHGINLSAKKLSGDFYDFFELDNGDIYFNLGDVSGKGVNAALLMAKTSSLFRCLGKRIHQPGKLLYEINNELCETSVHGMFVTMLAGIYTPETNHIKLVNAGNPPALLFTHKEICREFEATAPPLGVISDITYTEYSIELHNGTLYLYSDGVTEGYTEDDSELGLSGLFKLIANMDENMSVKERLQCIAEKISGNSRNLRDDVTILVVEKHLSNETT